MSWLTRGSCLSNHIHPVAVKHFAEIPAIKPSHALNTDSWSSHAVACCLLTTAKSIVAAYNFSCQIDYKWRGRSRSFTEMVHPKKIPFISFAFPHVVIAPFFPFRCSHLYLHFFHWCHLSCFLLLFSLHQCSQPMAVLRLRKWMVCLFLEAGKEANRSKLQRARGGEEGCEETINLHSNTASGHIQTELRSTLNEKHHHRLESQQHK